VCSSDLRCNKVKRSMIRFVKSVRAARVKAT